MRQPEKRERVYSVCSGMRIACDAWGDPAAPPVILLHGGGQTRYAWGSTAQSLARAGMYALAIDLRGHGDSDWSADGDYGPETYVADLHDIMQTLDHAPALVGASLGGITSLLCQGELFPGSASALVLVDITPRVERDGIERIVSFMTAHPEGFESLEQVADLVAEFVPHRPRPADTVGLEKNLRLGDDGRWRWHWDPKFLHRASERSPEQALLWPERLTKAAESLALPTLLVRGRMSDVVTEETAREFLESVPHAEFVDVENAAHMVAGDRNDVFSDAIIDFLSRTVIGRKSSAA
jgi:non-heme chloroperoxidase